MTSSSSHPMAPGPGANRATATAAAGVIALSAAIAGAVLASAIAGGAALEAPQPPGAPEVVLSTPAHPMDQTITTNGDVERRGGLASPLHAN